MILVFFFASTNIWMRARSIYLFNRDLRIEDNELLRRATEESDLVYPIFVLTPEQVINNKFANERAVTFMARSLIHLADKIPLSFFIGKIKTVVSDIIKSINATALYTNFDVTPFAIQRGDTLRRMCGRMGVRFVTGMDIFMVRHQTLTKTTGDPYVKFTPFYKHALKHVSKEKVASSVKLSKMRELSGNGTKLLHELAASSDNPVFAPGRPGAIRALRRFALRNNYSIVRDKLSANATSHLSAYIHLGILGPNEVVRAIKKSKTRTALVRQLLWREFYLYIVWRQHATYEKLSTIASRNRIRWRGDPRHFVLWCRGQTGCPIVDAGMRELNTTGYMQNRARLIVATFLVFYLHLNWTLGEAYFAKNLVDYDYCNNLGGWMWCAAWERHSNEYFRPLSVSSQMRRFDPEAIYVKKWVPELVDVEPRALYNWSSSHAKYAAPVVPDLRAARRAGIEMYRQAVSKNERP